MSGKGHEGMILPLIGALALQGFAFRVRVGGEVCGSGVVQAHVL